MKGRDFFCQVLRAAGADTVFGVPGTQNVTLFEGLRRSRLRTVLAGSELGASFMANGYFRASGRPGIFTTIPGPGFTYGLTGIAEARDDSAAVVMVVVKGAGEASWDFGLQDIDHRAVASSLTKGFFRIEEADGIQETLLAAWRLSASGEPGPVLLEVDPSVLNAEVTDPGLQVPAPDLVRNPEPAPDLVSRAWRAISEHDRILLFLGQGALDASGSLRELAASWEACVVSTSSGRGIIPETDLRSACGDFSGWGVDLVNELVGASDLVVALGCKFSHNGTSGFRLVLPREKLIHVDASPESLGRNYPASVSIQSGVQPFLDALVRHGEESPRPRSGWSREELRRWKQRFDEKRDRSLDGIPELARGPGGGMAEFLRRFRAGVPDDAIVVTDSGLHQLIARRGIPVLSPRGLILPSDFQSMGYGVPAAIGTALGAPGRKSVAVVGDGGMLMSGLEMATAVREGLDLTVVVFDDGHLGQIRRQQLSDSGMPFATALGEIRFEALAHAVGASYLGVDATNLEALEEALQNPGVTLIHLILSESRSGRKQRATGLIKAAGRTILGPRGIAGLKKLLGR